MSQIPEFEASKFVVAFSGECASSAVVEGWDNVLSYLDDELGYDDEGEGHTVRDGSCSLHDHDNWTHASELMCDDKRFIFTENEFDYLLALTIVRITDQ